MRRRNTGSAKRAVQKNKRKVGRERAAPTLTADLQKQLAQRTRERDEALDRETATSEVLQGGTGLGLAISKRIIEMHGAIIGKRGRETLTNRFPEIQ